MLKVGDYVRVKCYRDDLWQGWVGYMVNTIGKINVITEIDSTQSCKTYCVNGWWYLAEELEKLRTDTENRNELLVMLDEIERGFEKYNGTLSMIFDMTEVADNFTDDFYEPLNKMRDYIENGGIKND